MSTQQCQHAEAHWFNQVTSDLGFCGCGSPEEAFWLVRDLLRLCPFYENRQAVQARLPDLGVEMLVLYTIDHAGLIEHGGSVGGSWITEKGQRLLDLLERWDEAAIDEASDKGVSCSDCPDWGKP